MSQAKKNAKSSKETVAREQRLNARNKGVRPAATFIQNEKGFRYQSKNGTLVPEKIPTIKGESNV